VFPQFYFHVDRVVFAVVGFGPQNDAIVVSRKKLVAVAHRLDDLATDVRP
jgi:hypothetical protein